MKFVWNRAKKLRRRLERWTTALLFSAVQLASPHGSGAAPVLSSQRNRGRFSEIVYELAKLLTVLNPVPAVEELTAACLPLTLVCPMLQHKSELTAVGGT